MKKSAILASVVLAVSTLILGGCQQEPAQKDAARTAPDAKPGLSVAHARLVLPAVKGNPGAVYFDLTNNGAGDAVLAGVALTGAQETMMHDVVDKGGVSEMIMLDSLKLARGESASFAPGGKHVMAMMLDPALQPGGRTEITLTFAGGDKLSAEATIEAPGAAH